MSVAPYDPSRATLPPPSWKKGREPKRISEKLLASILEQIAIGVPPQTAAVAHGVNARTWKRWLEHGRAENAEEPYASMADRVDAAREFYHLTRVHLVHAGAEKDPRLAQWELERRFRDDWGDPRIGSTTVNVQVVEAERSALSERMAVAALKVLGDAPELLEAFLAEMGLGPVVEGEARELAA